METKLYVGNLNFRTTEESLGAAFEEAGFAPVSVKIITDRETGRSRGFAFVEMADEASAEKALVTMFDRMVDSRPLKVTEAKPRGAGGFSSGGPGAGASAGQDRGSFRPRPAYDDRGPPRGPPSSGQEARPRFNNDGPRPPREGGFGGRGGFGGGGGFMPPAPGLPAEGEEAGREGRKDRSKRRDMSKQHAERQEYDDDDGWE